MPRAPQGACAQCVMRYWRLFFVVSVIQMECSFERQHHLLGFSEEPSLPNRIVLGSLRQRSRGLTKEWVILLVEPQAQGFNSGAGTVVPFCYHFSDPFVRFSIFSMLQGRCPMAVFILENRHRKEKQSEGWKGQGLYQEHFPRNPSGLTQVAPALLHMQVR